jgi:hypothetical protein
VIGLKVTERSFVAIGTQGDIGVGDVIQTGAPDLAQVVAILDIADGEDSETAVVFRNLMSGRLFIEQLDEVRSLFGDGEYRKAEVSQATPLDPVDVMVTRAASTLSHFGISCSLLADPVEQKLAATGTLANWNSMLRYLG